jgi:hypothetical protein
MKYPLFGSTINITGVCADTDFSDWQLNLSFSNGTLIESVSGSSLNVSRQKSAALFSKNASFLDGSLYYDVALTCNDTSNNKTTVTKPFYALNIMPSSSISNASGSIYSYSPTIGFVCSDPEGEISAAYVYVNGVFNTSMVVSNGSLNMYVSNLSVGSHNVSVICNDSFRNSTSSSILFTYTTLCALNISGLESNKRYIDTAKTISMGCTNGLNISACGYSINKFEGGSISNCSNFNITLESGYNKVIFVYVSNGLSKSVEFVNVFAKQNQSGLASYIVLIILVLVSAVLLIWFGGSGQIPVIGMLSGVCLVIVGLYVFAFSIVAAIVVWVLALVVFIKSVF